MSAQLRRAVKLPYIAAITLVLFATLAWLSLRHTDSFQDFRSNSWPIKNPFSKSELRDLFRALHSPSIPVHAESYKEFGGQEWQREGEALWTDSLGQRLCIIDLDDRARDTDGQIFNEKSWNFDTANGLSAGVLNHYMYAQIHGYKYYYIRSETPTDRRPSWRKPPIISQILKKHDVCIYVDSDAIFYHLDLPFEWLLNYWRIIPHQTGLAMALDPNSDNNKDSFGRRYLNTGFIIAQNNPRTHDILDAWASCPEEDSKYTNCSNFKHNSPGKPTDQGAMGNYIRYDFEEKEDIRELPCTEANGFPESHSGCYGLFVRHVWTSKQDMLMASVAKSLAGAMFEDRHREFLDMRSTFYKEEKQI
ncbi:putative subunit of Golgi mannosyltransferase complex [Rhizodiscina lignyota]|uniref:Subunit of Golgi mannosyltransferase complex n=1 Tax=Rhizodiscina lignyota TaxID=1504668 RepID=A0A9P4MDY9_9PEZI|nr:putative subunit of Golgi mannosyltransferase complex [Rhizodiscina lignyota]